MVFIGPAPLGPFASLAAEMPLRKQNDVKKVKPGAKAGDTSSNTEQMPGQEARAAEARDIAALRREMERRDLSAGPSPAFQISLLEVDTDIQQVIARVEAARGQARDADALRIEAETEARHGEAALTEIAAQEQSVPDRATPDA